MLQYRKVILKKGTLYILIKFLQRLSSAEFPQKIPAFLFLVKDVPLPDELVIPLNKNARVFPAQLLEKSKHLCGVRKLIDIIPEKNQHILPTWLENAQKPFAFRNICMEITNNVMHSLKRGRKRYRKCFRERKIRTQELDIFRRH